MLNRIKNVKRNIAIFLYTVVSIMFAIGVSGFYMDGAGFSGIEGSYFLMAVVGVALTVLLLVVPFIMFLVKGFGFVKAMLYSLVLGFSAFVFTNIVMLYFMFSLLPLMTIGSSIIFVVVWFGSGAVMHAYAVRLWLKSFNYYTDKYYAYTK